MGALTATALVVGANDPLDNRLRLGGDYNGWVGVLVNGAYAVRRFRLDRDHWLVRGMDIPVVVDSDNPGAFDIAWDQIPSIEQRVAAQDPALTDPIGTYKRVLEAIIAAGVAGAGIAAPPQPGVGTIMRNALRGALRGGQSLGRDPFLPTLHAHAPLFQQGDTSVVSGQFDESIQNIAATPAPPGKVRAGVLFSAHVATLKSESDEHSSSHYYERHGKHEVVLSVTVPGAAPYATHIAKFDHKKGKAATGYMAAMPALVSATDRDDLEVQWDELLSLRQMRKQGKQMAAERIAALQQQQAAVMQAASAPMAPPTGLDHMESLKHSARVALEAAGDSPYRKAVIDQFRSVGVKISDAGVVED
jgi:hypothetical protein